MVKDINVSKSSVETSIFPEAWKEALVIPIPKGGNLTLVQNYRTNFPTTTAWQNTGQVNAQATYKLFRGEIVEYWFRCKYSDFPETYNLFECM